MLTPSVTPGSTSVRSLCRDDDVADKVLDINKTLLENGVVHDPTELLYCDIEAEQYLPSLYVHYNDDLTVA